MCRCDGRCILWTTSEIWGTTTTTATQAARWAWFTGCISCSWSTLVRQVALGSKAAKPENVLCAAIAENGATRVENAQLCGLDRPLDRSHQVYHIHLMVSPLDHPTHIRCRHSNHRSCLQCTQKNEYSTSTRPYSAFYRVTQNGFGPERRQYTLRLKKVRTI